MKCPYCNQEMKQDKDHEENMNEKWDCTNPDCKVYCIGIYYV